jgi:hypothetical protein
VTKGGMEISEDGKFLLYNSANPEDMILEPKEKDIIQEIENNGYKVRFINVFFTDWHLNKDGTESLCIRPNLLGLCIFKDKVVEISMKAFYRQKKLTDYYRKINVNPERLKKWKIKHPEFSMPRTEIIEISQLLTHELAHLIVHEKKMKDERTQESIMNEIKAKQKEGIFDTYLISRYWSLHHGRDFQRVYKRLCKNFSVKEDLGYKMSPDYFQ